MNLLPKTLELSSACWTELITDLKERGRGTRESGAFLLGQSNSKQQKVTTWLTYDALDSNSLHENYVELSPEVFTNLWIYCREHKLCVLADIHTHRYGVKQSFSDRDCPMISIPGHIAIIVPNYAIGIVTPNDVSFNVYQGSKQWESYYSVDAASRIKII